MVGCSSMLVYNFLRAPSLASFAESISSLEEESEDNVWRILPEQREYYTKQFKRLQPVEDGVVQGTQHINYHNVVSYGLKHHKWKFLIDCARYVVKIWKWLLVWGEEAWLGLDKFWGQNFRIPHFSKAKYGKISNTKIYMTVEKDSKLNSKQIEPWDGVASWVLS